MDATDRVNRLRGRLSAESTDTLCVAGPANVAYLTGFDDVFDEEPSTVVVVGACDAAVYTDMRYAEAARRAAEGTEWRVEVVRGSLWQTVTTALSEGAIAVEDSIPYATFIEIAERLSGRARPAHEWVEELRTVKEPEEIERIEAAQRLTDLGFAHILEHLRPGVSEREIALELEFFLRKGGSDGVAFPPIVASGPNSALPHAHVTDRRIEPGDFVKMDFGARVDGYCADMTRTVVVGRASDTQREIYETVHAANLAGIGAVAAGRSGEAIDAAARAVIGAAGYADRFTHGLGHGVGREVHEYPRVGPRAAAPLPEHSIITIEPGIYVEGLGGVRIEDLVVVESGSARVLTTSPKDLIEL